MLDQKVIDAYADGSPIGLIIESFNITYSQVIVILKDYKFRHTLNKGFTDDFKKLIAQRDVNGGKDITRKSIALELEITPNTVRKACEEFGQAFKDKPVSDRQYTRIDGVFNMKSCPSCKSKRVNKIDEKTTFCKKCNNEHIHNEDHVLKVNFQYIEE